jgi:hypothetical protein
MRPVIGGSARKTEVYPYIHEDLSIEATHQSTTVVEFRKKSNIKNHWWANMLNMKKILFSFIFVFFTYQVFSIDEDDIQIVNSLKRLGHLNNEIQIINSKKPKYSEYLEKIIFIKDNLFSKAIKIEKNLITLIGTKKN